MENPYSEDRRISQEYLISTCKYRQSELCCRYILFSSEKLDFFCAKNITSVRKHIDSVAEEMKARGDNCNGLGNKCDE